MKDDIVIINILCRPDVISAGIKYAIVHMIATGLNFTLFFIAYTHSYSQRINPRLDIKIPIFPIPEILILECKLNEIVFNLNISITTIKLLLFKSKSQKIPTNLLN